jgi:hypothetical protein
MIRAAAGSPSVTLALAGETAEPLPARLSWRGIVRFTGLAGDWQVVYGDSLGAVIVERDMGEGSIVLIGDSYPLSNQGLFHDRRPALVSWLIGPARRVIFDEYHLGVENPEGVMTLMREYRLGWVFAALLVVAALFVWRSASSLIPRREDGPAETRGLDSSRGLASLLTRVIPPADLLKVCLDERRRLGGRETRWKDLEAALQAVVEREKRLPALRKAPVAAYREMCALVERRKKGRTPILTN